MTTRCAERPRLHNTERHRCWLPVADPVPGPEIRRVRRSGVANWEPARSLQSDGDTENVVVGKEPFVADPIRVSGPVSGTDKTLTFETGKFAPQSQGAVVASIGGTTVLTTANAAKDVRPGMDFFPLTVDVEERAVRHRQDPRFVLPS
jgi:hypothetical protein